MRCLVGQSAALAQRSASSTFTMLWDSEFRVYSQFGEDGILEFLCTSLGLVKPKVLELGAGDFTECNSRFLAENRQASVFAVDAQPSLVKSVETSHLMWRNTIWPMTTWITPGNAPTLEREARSRMNGIDILSLDVDGNDFWIAQALDFEGISCVVVEYNPLFGGNVPVAIPRKDQFDRAAEHWSRLYYGASLKAWLFLMQSCNFEFLGTNRAGNNAFFVHRTLRNLVPLPRVDDRDLAKFLDWRVRESRDVRGRLTYLSHDECIALIGDLPLVNVVTGSSVTVREAYDQSPS